MNQTPLNRHWVREVDRRAVHDYGMSSLVLMENAARGAADVLLEVAGEFRTVAIVCGKGNNAGDGFALARHLDNRGIRVSLLLLLDPAELTGDALANFRIIEPYLPYSLYGRDFVPSNLPRLLTTAGCTVDAMLGTGATGDPRPPLDAVIPILNEYSGLKIALDLPSGLDCDTGRASSSTFRADHTVTFVAPKPGLLLPEAKPYVGQLHVVDIGAPRPLVEEITRLSQDGA